MRWLPQLVLLLTLSSFAHAQPQDEGGGGDQAANAPGANALYEGGFHLGKLLPNQIGGVTEIMSLGGARAALRLAPNTYAEAGMILGNGHGAEWKNTHLDIRMDIPVENLVGVATIGADMVYYKGVGTSEKIIFGGHAGAGIQMPLSGGVWFRSDMKFGFSPGTSLYIGFGLMFRLGESGP
jgi:hypothetical protein